MGKIGVGVGDDFPVDDGANRNAGAEQDTREEFEAWKQRREAYRKQREAWRAEREEWRRRKDEWRARWREQRRAWREGRYDAAGPVNAMFGHPQLWRGPLPSIFRILAIILAVAVAIFVITHLVYIIAGVIALGLLFASYHYFNHDPLDMGFVNRGQPGSGATPAAGPEQPKNPSPPVAQ